MALKMQPTSVIKTQLGINHNGRVQAFFTSECAKAMDKYVPFDKGNLANYYLYGNNKIVYDQIYAQYQYFGISKNGKRLNYHTDKHPLATSYWDKKMWTAEGQDVVRKVQKFFGGK